MKKLGKLDCLFLGNQTAEHAYLVLHGYGASMHDLAPLGEMILPTLPNSAWYFLQAPLQVPISPSMSGRAWFQIDMMKLQMATMQGDFASFFATEEPAGFEEATSLIQAAFKQAHKNHAYIHLAGFSQGAMLAAQVALENRAQVTSLSLLSGVLVAKSAWEKLISTNLNFLTFQSHGTQDFVLPVREGRKLRDFFNKYNSAHQYVEFSGGHEIPMPVLQAWQKFLVQAQICK